MNSNMIKESFNKHYKTQPEIYYAPGRVNLMGDHTDYNNGLVLPMAINLGTYVGISKNNTNIISVYSESMKSNCSFNLSESSNNLPRWAIYIYGIISLLQKDAYNLQGMDIYIDSNLPMGAGLSSSASLSIALCYAILDIHKYNIDKTKITLISQSVEHEFIGTKCGIMDQTICTFAKEKTLLKLDCNTNQIDFIDFNPKETSILICDTGIKHELCTSEYNIRKKECQEVSKIFNTQSLRQLTLSQLEEKKESLPKNLYHRALHVLTENQRVIDIGNAIKGQEWQKAGDIMKKSHQSLSNNYQVSCDELDFLIQESEKVKGIYGGRMTGGGFGGCAVFLIQHSQYSTIKSRVSHIYMRKFNKTLGFHQSSAHNGVTKYH